ncbi:hypothetical protein HBA54_27245 [Pelagibius litoralis]|uniref:GcrA cell cycle regulator n=1 Tax=Pelagibius litoralis TaxID=374515 RepID=A0A967F3F6_9PROT|nr:GcrA family cell cycle regulator [Pelagibius litoralis]NIA72293.1 hypothetical protein [Pelagibius litoralis]
MSNTAWPDEDVAELLEGAAAGRSNKELAESMGRTKNQIAGKLHRLRFQSQERAVRYAQHFGPKTDKTKAKSPTVVKSKPKAPRPVQSKRTAPDQTVRVARPSDSLWHPKTCQYPIGDPQHTDFHFCGESIIADGRPYCDSHQEVCTQPREKKAA